MSFITRQRRQKRHKRIEQRLHLGEVENLWRLYYTHSSNQKNLVDGGCGGEKESLNLDYRAPITHYS